MEVIAALSDPVRVNFLLALLRDAGFTPVIFDSNMAVMLGQTAVLQRIAVPAAQAVWARRVLREAGEPCAR